jgi:prepilin-type N-terminal cleavage/methylation domain-containing protein
MRRPYTKAFTLVELLVVIGIIAILISVLLPTLAKARQSANFIDCQARLRQMGQAMHIYVNTNKGMLPWGVIDHDAPHLTGDGIPNASYNERFTWWFFTLSEVMNKKLAGADGFVRGINGAFRDKDVIEGSDTRYINHYTSNPRVFYRNDRDDAPVLLWGSAPIDGPFRTQRKSGSVKNHSEVFVIWDGPQAMDQEYNTYGVAEALDAWAWYASTGLCYGKAGMRYDRPILPGQNGASGLQSGKAFQKQYNRDLANAFGGNGWQHLRFRHMNNTRLAALCLDGHVEAREVGTVMVKDIFTNPK